VKSLLPPPPLVYLITDGALTAGNFRKRSPETLRTIENAVRQKVSLVQIREKKLPAGLVCDLAARAARIVLDTQTKLLVNDRADIAFSSGADGVHLTADSIPAAVIRQYFPAGFIIGVSCHTFEECARAKTDGADFVTFSPVFASPGKGAPQGLKALREICERLKPFPVVALGGIDETNYESILPAAAGFAAIRFLNERFSKRAQTKNGELKI
jgi:thiamine-phosphate pyrophosphorylase